MSGHMLCTETSQLTRTQVYVRSTTNEMLRIESILQSAQMLSAANEV